MPELPEVEAARATAECVAAGRRITAVWCAGDPIVLEASPARLRQALLGRRVRGVGRHGKHLWLELDRRPWPVVHFGMSGGLYTPGRGMRLRASGREDWRAQWPPRFTKLRLAFHDGGGESTRSRPGRGGARRLRGARAAGTGPPRALAAPRGPPSGGPRARSERP